MGQTFVAKVLRGSYVIVQRLSVGRPSGNDVDPYWQIRAQA